MVEYACQRLKPYGNDSLQKMTMIYHENSKRDDWASYFYDYVVSIFDLALLNF